MILQITTQPVCEPITTAEMKIHLRVDHSNDDELIRQLTKAAREYAEGYEGRAYVVRTYEYLIDDQFPAMIEPPYPPLVGVSTIDYIDTSGETVNVAVTDYTTDVKSEPGRIYEAYGQVWPSAVRAVNNTITVNYIAGYLAQFEAVAGTDVITAEGRTYTDGDKVRLSNSGGDTAGDLPAGLSVDTDYWVRDQDGYTFKLAASSGGAAVDITDTGTGTHFVGEMPERSRAAIKLIVGHWYEHRETIMETQLRPIPLGAQSLLMQDRVSPLVQVV